MDEYDLAETVQCDIAKVGIFVALVNFYNLCGNNFPISLMEGPAAELVAWADRARDCLHNGNYSVDAMRTLIHEGDRLMAGVDDLWCQVARDGIQMRLPEIMRHLET